MLTLYIDEISMVRADLLDAIDVSLKKVKNQMFHLDIQMIFIGDMFQLSPVMMDKEQHIINQRYPTGIGFLILTP